MVLIGLATVIRSLESLVKGVYFEDGKEVRQISTPHMCTQVGARGALIHSIPLRS